MYGSNNMKKSVVFNNQFTPKLGGQFELESGGQFAPELVVNLHWKVVVNLTGFSRLEAMLTVKNTTITNIEPLLNKAISQISQLATLYNEGTTENKRKIIGSIFPEKLTFENNQVRTTRINEGLRLMLLFYKALDDKKKGTNQQKTDLSQYVNAEGFEPSTACLEGRCSIQLSYASIIFISRGGRIRTCGLLLPKQAR